MPAIPDIEIRPARADDPAIEALIARHLAHSAAHTPPESIYAMGPGALLDPSISVFAAWQDRMLLGMGALRDLSGADMPGAGEIKSMHTAAEARGRGVGRRLLARLLSEARARGFVTLYLETGPAEGYEAARILYARAGFTPCGPFGDHAGDPNSAYYRLTL
ncbi:MAG: GNAT family N-acetyltransferase [Pseudomonadota bacterium]